MEGRWQRLKRFIFLFALFYLLFFCLVTNDRWGSSGRLGVKWLEAFSVWTYFYPFSFLFFSYCLLFPFALFWYLFLLYCIPYFFPQCTGKAKWIALSILYQEVLFCFTLHFFFNVIAFISLLAKNKREKKKRWTR